MGYYITLTVWRNRPPSFLQFGAVVMSSSRDARSMSISSTSSTRNVQFTIQGQRTDSETSFLTIWVTFLVDQLPQYLLYMLFIIREFSRTPNLIIVSEGTGGGGCRGGSPPNSHEKNGAMVSG